MKLGSLFDGSGGFPVAGALSGITPVWASEIEPFPIRVTTKRFPDMKHLGDISRVNGADIEPVDVITFGSPCFVAGTMIQTNKALLPIEDVRVGDYVLTHTNLYQQVSKTMSRVAEEILLVQAEGSVPIFTTADHPFYVREMKKDYSSYISTDGNAKRHNNRTWGKPIWKVAGELSRKDYIGFAINQKKINPKRLTHEECYLVGRYIADGYINNNRRTSEGRKNSYNNKVVYCIGKSKIGLFIDKLDTYHACLKEERTAFKCEVYNKRLMQLCRECGRGAINKHFPEWIIDLPRELLELVLDGYISGDGCKIGEKYSASSISKVLMMQIQQIVAKIYGTFANLYFCKRPKQTVIEGRTVNQNDSWMVRYKKYRTKNTHTYYDGEMLWIPVREISKTCAITTVFNLEVEVDNSYTANNLVVHNCTDLSVAGQQAGLGGKHSSLFHQAIRIIKEMRTATHGKYPRFIVWENVPGAFSSSKGEDFRSVLEEVAKIKDETIVIPRPDKWETAGTIMGETFSVAWRTIDAQFWGVPQRRRRIYLVADFDSRCAGEVLFESQGLCRDTAQSGQAREGASLDSQNSTGTADTAGFNGWRSITGSLEFAQDRAPCINANMPPNVVYQVIERTLVARYDSSPCNDRGQNIVAHPKVTGTICASGADTSRPSGQGNEGDMCIVEMKADNICADSSNSMKSSNPYSGIYEAQTSRTIDQNGGNPSCNQGGLMIIDTPQTNYIATFMGGQDSKAGGIGYSETADTARVFDARGNGDGCIVNTVTGNHNNRITDYTTLVVDTPKTLKIRSGCEGGGKGALIQDNLPATLGCAKDQTVFIPVYALQGNGIDRADTAGCNGKGWREDAMYTLNTIDRPAVAYSLDRACFNQGENAKYETSILEEVSQTIVARGPSAVAMPPHYIVRRLMPIECARLQGMPDWWCDDLSRDNPTEEDIAFWVEVFETHRKAIGKSTKPKSKAQIIKWLKDPCNDSAEYKMWGNGIALPCAAFVMENIVK